MAKLMLQNVRLAFPALFVAKGVAADPNSKPRYGASFLIAKSDPQVKAIQDAIIATANEKWGAKAELVLKGIKAKDAFCVHDGALKPEYEGFEDSMYLAAHSATRPTVIDTDRSPLAEVDGKPYGGCYVNASVDLWAQDNQWGKRVNASLRGVQFVKDGDAFSAAAPASADEFEDLGVSESAATTASDAGDLF